MEIAATTAQAGTQPQPSKTSDAGAISSDFETFLKMLTAQMRNQDPMNPVDSTDYAVQLATFSSVEQQVLTNDLLSGLSAQITSGISDLAGWIGMQVRAPVSGSFDGAPVELTYAPQPGAGRHVLVVRDAQGDVVSRSTLPPGESTTSWAGVDSHGRPVEPGRYHFEVESYTGDTLLGTQQAQVYARVTEARIEDGEPVLILEGGARVAPGTVTALRAGD
jgi:flagellar basal-body rod modification protein FlgD